MPRTSARLVLAGAALLAALVPTATASAAGPACTTTARSADGAESKVARARGGAVVCLANGTYGDIDLSAVKSRTVTLRPATLGRATVGSVDMRGRGLRLFGFVVHGQVTVEDGGSRMSVERNAISGGSFGVFANGDQGRVSGITIARNRITGFGTSRGDEENDLIRLHDFRGVRVVGNELSGIAETGGHSDVLQTVHGGAGLVIARNYVHDQNGTQGFFVKDGAVTNLTISDNLIVGDPEPNGYAINVYETRPNRGDPFYTGHGALISRNTIIRDSSGIAIRGCDSEAVLVERNVAPYIGDGGDGCRDWTSTGNVVRRSADKARIGKAGVTWQPSRVRYGP